MLIERVRAAPVDLDLLEKRERDAEVLLAEGCDFGCCAWLLAAELIAGKAENAEAAWMEPTVKGLEAGILGSKAALAGHIDDQEHVSAIRGERRGLAVQGADWNVVENPALLSSSRPSMPSRALSRPRVWCERWGRNHGECHEIRLRL